MDSLKLFMLLLGCKPPGRHIEQHDIFFGIAHSLKELVPEMKSFWSHSNNIHIDAWREVTTVDNYSIAIVSKTENVSIGGGVKTSGIDKNVPAAEDPKLFFINLGGYQENKFEEQHYFVLTVKNNRNAAFAEAKATLFYRENHIPGAGSHIDDRYGIDVDDLYQIDEMLSSGQKELYSIRLLAGGSKTMDEFHLGYLPINNL